MLGEGGLSAAFPVAAQHPKIATCLAGRERDQAQGAVPELRPLPLRKQRPAPAKGRSALRVVEPAE